MSDRWALCQQLHSTYPQLTPEEIRAHVYDNAPLVVGNVVWAPSVPLVQLRSLPGDEHE